MVYRTGCAIRYSPNHRPEIINESISFATHLLAEWLTAAENEKEKHSSSSSSSSVLSIWLIKFTVKQKKKLIYIHIYEKSMPKKKTRSRDETTYKWNLPAIQCHVCKSNERALYVNECASEVDAKKQMTIARRRRDRHTGTHTHMV